MKQNALQLLSWFNELSFARKELPSEITKVFSDDEKSELKKSVYNSFEYIEGVLSFGNLISIKCENDEEIWFDLLTMLENSSYYACLSMPLVRQLLETKEGFICTSINDKSKIIWTDIPHSKQPKNFQTLSDEQQKLANDVWNLACRIVELGRRYMLLSSAKELVDWSRYFLECSACLIMLAARASTLNS